ncbi:hypothetical protein LQ318_05580 [Aliifodinibius salicampi]|uniref:Lycopene beta-cyclase n=1 Tax=Fodinibius salicampi TaxID=1920655 RepID=A0ABT3PWZ5_9BACT|nr:hypothetical protein [Fodinibius salicampi]
MGIEYDYIIAGAGAAGLSLAWQMLHSPLKDKKVLIIDKDLKLQDDKTWCFWHSGEPPFQKLIHKRWSRVEVESAEGYITQSLQRYPYYALKSYDFEKKIIAAIKKNPSFHLLESPIQKLSSDPDSKKAYLHTPENILETSYIFQSCFDPFKIHKSNVRYPLRQHFLGWDIKINTSIFNSDVFTLMDFDHSFTGGVAFTYVLPWTSKTALLEYTIFSENIIAQEKYEEKLSAYLSNRYGLEPDDYQIERKEYGVIPMEDRPALPWYKPRIMNIGTQGGVTKPSTGYTFMRIQNQVKNIVEGLIEDNRPLIYSPSKFRFKAYDLWLLHIIYNSPKEATTIFKQLFQNNKMDEVFCFLNEDSILSEDLQIMSSVPYRPFLKAIWKSKKRLREIGRK